MKTLKKQDLPENRTTLLEHVANNSYDIHIYYLGEQDINHLDASKIQPDELVLDVRAKDPYLPNLLVLLENKTYHTHQTFALDFVTADLEYVPLEKIPSFRDKIQTAEDALNDIKELLNELVPNLMV